jgi:basic amino acid/polyamine antiporter, APA family
MNTTQQLNRTLGLGMVIVLVIGNILGSGVYKKVAPMAAELQSSGWVLVCWVLGGIISLFGALSYAEVAGLLADTGGDYAYYKKIYNKFFAFLFGWSSFTIIQTASISSLAYLFAHSINSVFALPDIFNSLQDYNIGNVFYPFADFKVKLTAILLIIVLTLINTRGIKTGAWFSTFTLVLVLTGIFSIVAFGLASDQSQIKNAFNMQPISSEPVGFSAIFTALLAAFWAYQGWAAVGFTGGEIKNANRNIPVGIVSGIFIVIATYLLVNATYLSLLPIQSLSDIHQSGNKIAAVEAVKVFGGNNGALLIASLILVTTLSCAHATILGSCRIYYAMAKEGMFFKSVAKLNSRQVPANSLKFQGVLACILVLSGTFDQLTDMIIFAVFIFYGATALAVFLLRKRMPDAPRPYKVWGYPVVPAFVILFSAALFVNTLFSRPREAGIGLVLMLTAVPMFWWFRKSFANSVHKEANSD